MFAASPRSVPVALARSRVGWIACSISLGEKPIRPRLTIPSATCFAVKEVSLPSLAATCVSDSNSCLVALVTARTSLIWSSKSAKPLTAIAIGTAKAPESISISLPIAVQDRPKF